MQVYGSLALEDNSEVGEAVLGDAGVFPLSEPVHSSSQPKKQTRSLQWVLLGEDLMISPTCEGGGGVASSIPTRTNCERAWIGFSDQP